MNQYLRNLVLIVLLSPFITVAAQRNFDKEHQLELQLQTIDSNLVTTFRNGTTAMDQGDLILADSLYSIVMAKAPSFDPVLRRLGSIRASLGKPHEGLYYCTKALEIKRSAYNLLSLANFYTFYEGYKDLPKAMELLREARSLPDGGDIDIIGLIGQVQLQQNDIEGFRKTAQLMRNAYPGEMYTHYFSAIENAVDNKWTDAKNEILQAKELGLDEGTVQGFLDSGINKHLKRKSWAVGLIFVVAAWMAGLLLLFAIGKIISNITMKSIEKDELGDRRNQSLRSFYKSLINAGGIYYYISLPIIILLVIGLAGAIIYLFILAGRIPIKFVLILVVGACISIYAMIRSLLVKVKSSDPGRELKRDEAPKLFELTEEVAKSLDTRPIDEIRITHGTDLAVYERGTWKEKLGDQAQRILILGTGVLKDFKKSDFKAILAHEYGHFAHRDTAGGEIALRVMNDMSKYFYALYEHGQTVWWNFSFQFLRLYHFIFRRKSHGSTRLQEVMADRVAVQTYGQAAFQNGLTHVIRRDIEFNYLANKEIELGNLAKRSFSNFYNLTAASDGVVETELDKALNLKTTEDDTHPCPSDRFKYASRISTAVHDNDSQPVTDLFVDWNSLTQEMSQLIADAVKNG